MVDTGNLEGVCPAKGAAATVPFGFIREARSLEFLGDILKFRIFKCWDLIQNLKMSNTVWAKQNMNVDQIQPIFFS